MNYRKLEELQAKKKVSNREIARDLNISDSGYKRMITDQTITVKMLEKLAEYYQVDINIFFNGNQLKTYSENSKIDFVEDYGHVECSFCKIKDKRIADLEMHRDDLRKQLNLKDESLGKNGKAV